MAGTVFSDIFTLINDSATDILTTNVAGLMSVITPVLVSAFTLYVIFVFMSYFETNIGQSMWDIIKRIAAWGVILSFSINIGSYTTTVVPLVTGLGDGLASLMGGGSGIDASLNDLAIALIDTAVKTWENASGVGESVMAALGIVVMIIFGTVFLVISAAYIILAKLYLAILAILGPIFISLALFPATRQFFSSWVNQVVNYSLLILILSLIVSIFVKFIQNLFGTVITDTFDLPTLFYLPAILGIFSIILLRVPDLAASLSGGMGGMASGANAIAGAGGGVASGANAAAGKAIGKAAGKAVSAAKNKFGKGNGGSIAPESEGK